MAHIIILGGIEDTSGTPSGGCFADLLGYLPTIEDIEHIEPGQRTEAQAAVYEQAEAIAGKFQTNGFTIAEICDDTTELGNLIAAL